MGYWFYQYPLPLLFVCYNAKSACSHSDGIWRALNPGSDPVSSTVSSSEKLSNGNWLNAGTSTGLSWITLNFALLFKLTESLENHFVSSYAVNWLNCQFVKIRNPTISDLAFDIVKYFVFNLLNVCGGRSVLAQYYLQIYNLHCPDVEIKDTHPCQDRPDVGNKTGHSLMASICMIWMDNCWIDHHDYATEMPS